MIRRMSVKHQQQSDHSVLRKCNITVALPSRLVVLCTPFSYLVLIIMQMHVVMVPAFFTLQHYRTKLSVLSSPFSILSIDGSISSCSCVHVSYSSRVCYNLSSRPRLQYWYIRYSALRVRFTYLINHGC